MSTAIVWFRNDLRVHDHEPLIKAIENHDSIIPFYCFENKFFTKSKFGLGKTGNHRAQFLIESIANLKQNLQKLGGDLVVSAGEVEDEIKKLVDKHAVDAVYCYKDIHAEEIESQKGVENIKNVIVKYSFGSTLFHINDLPFDFRETPKVFTQFRKELEKKSKIREQFPSPKEINLPKLLFNFGDIPSITDLGLKVPKPEKRAAINAKGGEDEALARLNHYFFQSEELSFYKQKRNGLLGEDYSSKLSLWLWNGCVSPRKIYWEVKKYEQEIKKNQSTYWLVFELIWRDYFKFISLKHGNAIFWEKGIKDQAYNKIENQDWFNKWTNGTTGIPFIDANMRELNATGFMSNRGRQNVASFLVKELELDWRLGAAYFEEKLIDYDVASNYGNWMYIAGVGNDPRDRYFNIILQAKRYDSNGKYVKHWIPELNEIDSGIIHHPWTREETLFTEQELDYPKPIVEPEYWKKHY